MKRQARSVALLALLPTIVMACSLFSSRADNSGTPEPGIVTATPAEGTAEAQPESAAVATATGTPTPTLDPAFPTPALVESWVAEQEFERGWAFALLDRAEIWVAVFTSERGGTWSIYQDEFFLEEQATGQELIAEYEELPPEGMVMPIRGFGWLWVNNPEVREALGWGVWIELGQNTTIRYDAGGLINADDQFVPRPGRFTLVNIGGDVFIFDEATQTFTREPSG